MFFSYILDALIIGYKSKRIAFEYQHSIQIDYSKDL